MKNWRARSRWARSGESWPLRPGMIAGPPVRAAGPARTLPIMLSSLGIVLPAYNEEARLGPALDELFEYLCSAPPGELP